MSAYYPGVALIWAAMAVGLASIWGYVQVMRGDASALGYARRTYWGFALAVVGAAAVLMTKLLQHDFRLSYVFNYSSSDLPLHYLVSTFWAGQEGSFLLWLFFGALIGIPLYRSAKEQEAPTMIVYSSTFLALVAILMKQTPFKFLPPSEIATDGKGLNPLLQDPWMVIHPPVMFVGFASLSVPFAFAIAGLWKKRYDSWIVRSLPWVLVSFVTLGTAILMGGYWAYKTLGWGGYWGWDPVENTSLVPWLAVTALLHGMYVQKVKGRYRRLNFSLAVISYVCIVYGTFLTRSGVLADFSVHSFVDLGITGWLLAFLGSFLVLGVVAIVWRWREIPSEEVTEPLLSRGVFLLLGIAALLASAFVILLGTSAPLVTRLSENPSQVSTSFYNLTTSPVALLLLSILALLPFVDWRGVPTKSILKGAVPPFVFAAATTAFAVGMGIRKPWWLLLVGVGVFAFASNLLRYTKYLKGSVFLKGGAWIAHAGMSLMLVGIILSSAFDTSEKVTLAKDRPTKLNGYELTFQRVMEMPDGKAGLETKVTTPGGESFLAYPKFGENARTKQTMANPHVEHHTFYDVYLSPQEYNPGDQPSDGSVLTMKKGTTAKTPGGMEITFHEFVIDFKKMMAGEGDSTIGLNFTIGGKDLELRYSPKIEGGGPGAEAEVPGAPAGSRIRVAAISAGSGEVQLALGGPPEFAGTNPGSPERITLDMTIKPMINLVWGGFYILMFGGLFALIERWRQSRAAANLPQDAPIAIPEKAPSGIPATAPAEA